MPIIAPPPAFIIRCEYRSICALGADIEESNDHNRDFHYKNFCVAKNEKSNFLNHTLARLAVEEDVKERFACPGRDCDQRYTSRKSMARQVENPQANERSFSSTHPDTRANRRSKGLKRPAVAMENASPAAPPTTNADVDTSQISNASPSQGGFWETSEWSSFSNSMELFRSSSQSAIQDLSAQVARLTVNTNDSNKTLHLAVDMMQGLLKNQVDSTNRTLSSIGRLQVASIATLNRVEKKLETALFGVRDTVSSLQIDVTELRNEFFDKTERIMTDLEDQRVGTHEMGQKLDTLPLGCSSPDPDMSIEEYFKYTRGFAEQLDKLGEDYLRQYRKKRKITSKSKQAPSTLNTNNLPDDINHIHRAKAAMTARANKEFMGPNDLELSDDEQTSEQEMKERQE
ncbi:hypothetical protein EC957_006328 [Mortierella hygrophila]|uniref:Uncharacterized protein n=1 Tax=Mortierella hygrophila TaxID=979708 RepID=A0A9P6K6G2_9FUNG|nr:hypothetical protein EC957_006328 [Mortierella hygrophila]